MFKMMDNLLVLGQQSFTCTCLMVCRLNSGLDKPTANMPYFRSLLDSLVVECWLRVREVPGSIPSQGPRHTKDVIKMVE